MELSNLDTEFDMAVKSINDHKEPFPADTLLNFMLTTKKPPMITADQVAAKPLSMRLKQMHYFRLKTFQRTKPKDVI
tara:strand:- start:172 stop:402 length:231 start_codon:yes stop_codon:yes gene_type:complete